MKENKLDNEQLILSSKNIDYLSTSSTPLNRAKVTTRLSFFMGGFSIACWAPMVPFAAQRLHADSVTLGTILLSLGLGALFGMPIAGNLVAKKGAKLAITIGGVGLMIALPLLAIITNPILLALSLAVLGASIGIIDVAANIHGTAVQHMAKTSLMSGFHGFYSIGGLVGAMGMTLSIGMGLTVIMASLIASLTILILTLYSLSGFLTLPKGNDQPAFAFPKGIVWVIGLLLFTIFLAEGAVLDWGAILLSTFKGVEVSLSGIGYTIFALTLTISRFLGDFLVTRFGSKNVLLLGMLLTGGGLIIATLAKSLTMVLVGIGLAGLAAGNVVPILFTAAGQQKIMPVANAIAAASTLGYLGILIGPAFIGYVSHFLSLPNTLLLLGILTMATIIAIPYVIKH